MTVNPDNAALVTVVSDGQPVLCEDLLKLINREHRNGPDLRTSLKKSTLSQPIPVRILLPCGQAPVTEHPSPCECPAVARRRPTSSLAISDIAESLSKSKSNLSIDSALDPRRRRVTATAGTAATAATATTPCASVHSVTLSGGGQHEGEGEGHVTSRSSPNPTADPLGKNVSFSCNLPGRWSTAAGQDPTDAIYEVSNDYIKLIGCRRQFINLLPTQSSSARPASSKTNNMLCDADKLEPHQQLLDAATTCVSLSPGQDNNQSCYHLPKRRSAYGVLWKDKGNWRMRLKRRKKLFHHRNTICDLCLLFALCGIAVAILDAELTSNGILLKVGVHLICCLFATSTKFTRKCVLRCWCLFVKHQSHERCSILLEHRSPLHLIVAINE